ncbi:MULTISPECIES: competence type IV pilus minor pilin ComGD [Salimicrobium]|uniref:ComG operon protein 4 n=3 Tax=Salimicrobium TaxID=351195 RepID=K2H9C1_9BACI|nr:MULTISPECIES: competence type IV pilus minor pilin ComGD [Salimicrobium]AKG04315.1 hypothetical protein AAV35_005635 [Salimicrobium jeotgali]EKE32290.1 ComG operon protein 4 [Salimicrobium jeotgali]MBM7695903.1 competence protein ComGD [Salimicrobium jeotgali]SDX69280.1 competence protein ComGD [Salimicrobium album]SIS53620.1 competence protein ComGD [Salimicrobium salexigens]
MFYNHKGFTMVEVIVVLCFITVSLAILAPGQHLSHSHLTEKQTIQQFADDIHFAQQMSVQKGIEHTLYIDKVNNVYRIYESWGSSPIIQEEFPPEWEIQLATLKSYTTFHVNGTISTPGTMWFHTGDKQYKVTFPFSRNGVVIDEQ